MTVSRAQAQEAQDAWLHTTLGNLVELQRGVDLPEQIREVGHVPIMGGGGPNGTHSTANVRGPGVVVGRSGAGFGKAWGCDTDFWAHNAVLFVKDFKGNDPRFVYYLLSHLDFTSFNSGGAQPSLNRNFIYPIEIAVPPLVEQRRISAVLKTWDYALDALDRQLAAKNRALAGIADRSIDAADYPREHLRVHLKEVSERNSGGRIHRVLSVTNRRGFVPAEEVFAHRVASADASNYKVVRRGQYAYNPSRLNVGSISRLDDYEIGILSPMYVVFEITSSRLSSDFFLRWLSTSEARQRIRLAAQGSVRETVSFDDLCSIYIPLPPLDRQREIAAALSAMDEEICALTSRRTALARQKRGLMQKLLTGEWRVPETGTAGVAA